MLECVVFVLGERPTWRRGIVSSSMHGAFAKDVSVGAVGGGSCLRCCVVGSASLVGLESGDRGRTSCLCRLGRGVRVLRRIGLECRLFRGTSMARVRETVLLAGKAEEDIVAAWHDSRGPLAKMAALVT